MALASVTRYLSGGLQGDVSLYTDTNSNIFVLKRFFESKYFAAEQSILNEFRGSQNIVQFHDVSLPSNVKFGIPLKMYAYGDLFNFISCAHDKGLMTEKLAKSIFKKIVLGVDEMHKKNVAHRDLKPENIFVDNDFNVVLGDFGLASMEGESKVDNRALLEICGTKAYMSPEMFECEKTGCSYNGYSSDMWSVACLLFLILTGNMPLGERGACRRDWYYNRINNDDWEPFWEQHNSSIPTPVSPEAREVVQLLFKTRPEQRLTAVDVLELGWFKDECLLGDNQFVEVMGQIAQYIDPI